MTTAMAKRGAPVDMATWFSVNRFLTEEARLLDNREYEKWVELFTEDVHYFIPSRKVRMISAKPGDRDLEHELSSDGRPWVMSENIHELRLRVARVNSARQLWCENPPARNRHLVTNVETYHTEVAEELSVRSSFAVLHARFDSQGTTFIGERQDVLRRAGDTYKIAYRKVVLDSTVIWAGAISTFF
ncbi:aromatic-ring-hydroxylating dioxygenase subunit beta [Actinomadura rubrisoli]|uniref:3-phenylpropionate/cinnamic acid dioxygenase subunit beta n=1 Tax=Actinomadura rubrisoli TaxID=2530368 RepID=A0A4R5BYE4_9ACTN|nr:aromatic-ring-hydroxylating dioxygenase subunit beta [Actinomadura rubrisoli]TDD92231.1 3-phenylpropionate/cinnamic acid dioxygenase subunit beta [Actinomadura rubrisoli]